MTTKKRAKKTAAGRKKPPTNTATAVAENFPEDGMATVREACVFLHVTHPVIYQLISKGLIESVKILRARRISWQSLRKFAAQGC